MENIPIDFKILGGGLNTTSGVLRLKDQESSDLQNVEFSKFGSIVKRLGYYWLNPITIPISGAGPYVPPDPTSDAIIGDTGVAGIPLFDLGYAVRSAVRLEEEIGLPDFTLSHTESLS
jgi:hypothetical protein